MKPKTPASECGFYLREEKRFCGDYADHQLLGDIGYRFCEQHFFSLIKMDFIGWLAAQATPYCVTCGKARGQDVGHSEVCRGCLTFFGAFVTRHRYCGQCGAARDGGVHTCARPQSEAQP